MSTQDYDEIEKLFAGTWKCEKDENLDEFMTAGGLPEDTKALAKKELIVTLTRDGDSFKEKTTIDGVPFEVTIKLNESFEFKEKEENPAYHAKTFPTFKDGVLTYEVTPQRENGGKKHIYKMYIQGDELIADLSYPDGPSLTAKRFYKKC